jgi:hypothetical protein
MKNRPAIVLVSGGNAYAYESEGVDVRIIDLDNIKAGDGKVKLPADRGFEALVHNAVAGDYVEFVTTAEEE